MAFTGSSRVRSFLIGTAGLVALLALLPLSSKAQLDTQVRAQADSDYLAQNFKEAIEGYRQHLRRDRDDGVSWFKLAISLHWNRQFKEAIPAYEEALRRKTRVISATYNIACALARDGQTEAALDMLDLAQDRGFNNGERMQQDADLVSLMELDRFKAMVARAGDPAGHYPTAKSLRKFATVWNARSETGLVGRAEARLTSNRFAMPFSLVVADSRVISLMLYYSTSEDSWYAIGADAEGGAYDGPLAVSAGEMVADGIRAFDDGVARVRMVLVLQGDDTADLSMEVMDDGVWRTESSYRLRKVTPATAQ